MSKDKYEGKIGPADAMSALHPSFHEAYAKATREMMAAVLEFERATGRVVDQIEIEKLDITRIDDTARHTYRQTSMHFLPTPKEVDW